jgi:aryl-alcohol dehydrogenase-like predicted oxidoreductase
LEDFCETPDMETLQPPYHLFRREIEDVYGRLAHVLSTGTLDAHTASADDACLRNPAMEKFAAERDITVSQLAIAWTPALVYVPIVGTRDASHVEDSITTTEVSLNDADLDEIDKIMASATQVAGPCPENVY